MPGGVPGDSEHPDGTSGREGPPPKTLPCPLPPPPTPPHRERGNPWGLPVLLPLLPVGGRGKCT
jgi:hypothetical protein